MDQRFSYIKTDIRISKILESGRIPHAMLLVGKAGIGKLVQALRISKFLLCANGTACNDCTSCQRVEKLIHPDLHFSFPTIGKDGISDQFISEWRELIQKNPFASISDWLKHLDADKKQGNIPKAECANILKKINLRAYEGGNKISIIWLPEYLGGEGNRLLKLIEEPPENSYFILVSNEPERILGTILSRCQMLNILPPKNEEIKEVLLSLFEAKENEVQSIIALADGDINKAINLVDSDTNENFEFLKDFLRKCFKGEAAELQTLTENLSTLSKQNLKGFFEYFIHFLRQCLLINFISAEEIQLQNEELVFANKFSKMLDSEAIELLSRTLSEDIYYVERNANVKLLLINLGISLNRLFKKSLVNA